MACLNVCFVACFVARFLACFVARFAACFVACFVVCLVASLVAHLVGTESLAFPLSYALGPGLVAFQAKRKKLALTEDSIVRIKVIFETKSLSSQIDQGHHASDEVPDQILIARWSSS